MGYPLIPGERSVAWIKREPRAQMDERFPEDGLDGGSMLHPRGEQREERERERIF